MPNFRNVRNQNYRRRKQKLGDKQKSSRDSNYDLEIPGFYYDREKKRYFRLTPGVNNHNPLTLRTVKQKCLLESARAEEKQIKPQGNIVKLLHYQQLNILPYLSFKNNIFWLKLSQMKFMQKVAINSTTYADSYPLTECKYLIGSPKCAAVVAVCTLQKGGTLIETFKMHSKRENEAADKKCDELNLEFDSIVNLHPKSKLTDLCWVEPEPHLQYVLYTAVDFVEKQPISTLQFLPLFHFCNPSERVDIERNSFCCELPSVLWSCAWNSYSKTCAAGGEECIYQRYLERNDSNANGQQLPFEGNCFSLSYDSTGNLLFAGSNKGNLACLDVRNSTSAFSMKLTRGLSYLKLLLDENYLLASAYDGKLMQVDLRAQKIVLEYPHHVNDHLKLPFSVDEEANILCSVGQDHVTRLWMLREGTFLKSFVPGNDSFLSETSQPMSWFSNSWELPLKRKACLVIASGANIGLYYD